MKKAFRKKRTDHRCSDYLWLGFGLFGLSIMHLVFGGISQAAVTFRPETDPYFYWGVIAVEWVAGTAAFVTWLLRCRKNRRSD